MKIKQLGIDIQVKNLHLKEIFSLTLAIVCYRQFITYFYGEVSIDPTVNFLSFIALTIGNVPLTISLVWINFLVSKKLSEIEYFSVHTLSRVIVEFGYLFAVSALSSLIVNASMIWSGGFSVIMEKPVFIEQFLSVMAFDTAIYYVISVVQYFRSIHKAELTEQINKRNKVNYQYSLLKHQLNPHFLFNSLNVLDQLVRTEPDRASRFITKLADVYRYQLSHDQKESVPLSMELRFVESYMNLLKERFSDAISMDVLFDQSELESYRIIPCALQLLVENAVKHNVVSDAHPLKIKIELVNGYIVTSNNIAPKYTKSESWGIGLKSIKEQYRTIFNEEVKISQRNGIFSVSLPLIQID